MFHWKSEILPRAIHLALHPKLLTLVCPTSKFISTHELNKYHMCWIVYIGICPTPSLLHSPLLIRPEIYIPTHPLSVVFPLGSGSSTGRSISSSVMAVNSSSKSEKWGFRALGNTTFPLSSSRLSFLSNPWNLSPFD